MGFIENKPIGLSLRLRVVYFGRNFAYEEPEATWKVYLGHPEEIQYQPCRHQGLDKEHHLLQGFMALSDIDLCWN